MTIPTRTFEAVRVNGGVTLKCIVAELTTPCWGDSEVDNHIAALKAELDEAATDWKAKIRRLNTKPVFGDA